VFAQLGYDGTTIIAVADQASVSPTTVYHYFEDKSALYVGVFEATAPLVWSNATDGIREADRVVDAIDRIVHNWAVLERQCPGLTPFMLSVPREARLHAEFRPLLDRRSELQDGAFRALATFGRETGELAALSETDAFEFLRATVMGWIIEGHNRQREFTDAPVALQHVVELLATKPFRSEPAPRRDRPR
jgi:AcrR family transcriptional regulator